jgi:hypothetical protein
MVGNAPPLATEYNNRVQARAEPNLDVWGKDTSLPR